MAEWSIAAVLKTVELRGSGGSNPSLSAKKGENRIAMRFSPFLYALKCRIVFLALRVVVFVSILLSIYMEDNCF